jgi:glycosyltransferase involved in cell wall biosynthesis
MVTTVPVTLRAFLLPFAEHFRARGFRVDAMARGVTQDADCVRAFDRVWDIEWSRNPLRPANLFRTPRLVRELVEREGYDLVHVHTPVAAFVTRFALRNLRRENRLRVIYTAHGFHFFQGGPRVKGAIFRRIEKLAGRWTDHLVVINREDESAARRYHIVPDDRVHFMPGIGVDTTLYDPNRYSEDELARLRREVNLPESAPVLMMLAEFIARKRHSDCLHAFARCGRPDAVLAFLGDGPLEDAMRQLAASLGIADRVRFLGYRRDISKLIRLARATILPSAQEGLPRSVMESLCLEVPVIGSRIRGTSDLLDQGGGLLVPVGDVAALAAAMQRMIDHPDEARAMGERGRRGMADYDQRAIVRLHEELYDEALRSLPIVDRPALVPAR